MPSPLVFYGEGGVGVGIRKVETIEPEGIRHHLIYKKEVRTQPSVYHQMRVFK